MRYRASGAGLLCLLALAPAASVSAQDLTAAQDTAVVAGHYAAGGFHRWLFGTHYRALWTDTIRVPFLDLGARGGLEPVEKGGGMQTTSLHLKDAAGRPWDFRSVNKDPSSNLPPKLRTTFVRDILRDQTSAQHPGGMLVTAPLLEAVGVPHPHPHLAVMPDDPRLGKYRKEFAGMLGEIEEDPDEGPHDTPGFAGYRKIVGSDKLLERINGSPANRVDARRFLTVRLVDMLVNDWDRHEDQWRWGAETGRAAPDTLWQPIPRDRDQALVDFDGLILAIVRYSQPKLVTLGPHYQITGLTVNGRDLDRRLLVSLPWSAWDSVTRFVQARITDSVISGAIARLPAPWRARSGDHIARVLRARRDRLEEAARGLFVKVSSHADVHATDERDSLVADREPDGAVRIRLLRPGDSTAWFDRTFRPEQTSEIRVYLHEGNDAALIRGEATRSITLRVVGGNGTNRMDDRSIVGGRSRPTHLYARGRTDSLHYRGDSTFDWRPLVEEKGVWVMPKKDFGQSIQPYATAGLDNDFGFQLTLGADRFNYGFLRRPYDSRVGLRVSWASAFDAFRVTLDGDRRSEGGGWYPFARLRLSGLEAVRFYGIGNDTPDLPDSVARAGLRQYGAEAGIALEKGSFRAFLNGVLAYNRTDSVAGRLISGSGRYGSGDVGQLGLRAGAVVDKRNRSTAPSSGSRIELGAAFYPGAWDITRSFGEVHGNVETYLGAPLPFAPVLALRAGGKRVWGHYPWYEAAFLGGAQSVRGVLTDRYAGDASAYGNAELRLTLAHATVLFPLTIGVHGLADAGRVWVAGQRSDTWHSSVGGGVWVSVVDPLATLSATWAATDERGGFYLRIGFLY